MQYPRPLVQGDKVAILAPSSPVKEEYIYGAVRWLEQRGLRAVVMPHAIGEPSGSYASSYHNRIGDFLRAWNNPEIRAVLCARGGYGAVHLLERLSKALPDSDPKWLVGFSDISALHALMLQHRIGSVHGPMARHLTERPADGPSVMLDRLLFGVDEFVISSDENKLHPLSCPGEGMGRLVGGNLAVINGLFGTPFDPVRTLAPEPVILFIEDIGEKIYAVERMLYHLYLSGSFERINGLVVGQFSEYTADRNYRTMEDMIAAFLRFHGLDNIPVWFDAPIGHVNRNFPIVEGSRASLTVSGTRAELEYFLF